MNRFDIVQTLLDAHPAKMTQQTKTELSDILKVSLLDLPAEKQISVLESDWSLIGSPDLLPALQQLAKKPLKNPGSNESNSYTTRELKSIALERWYQLDPDGARQEAISQVGSSHPSLTAEALQFLGSVSLPQFESLWADAFMNTSDYQQETVFASLLARFGTGDAVAIIREKAEVGLVSGPARHREQRSHYLVKFDPASARPLVE